MLTDSITATGYKNLLATRDTLLERLREAGQAAGDAAGDNRDWHDNPGYDLAVAEMQIISSQLAEVERRIATATIVEQSILTGGSPSDIPSAC
jgi:hypothetical protein